MHTLRRRDLGEGMEMRREQFLDFATTQVVDSYVQGLLVHGLM